MNLNNATASVALAAANPHRMISWNPTADAITVEELYEYLHRAEIQDIVKLIEVLNQHLGYDCKCQKED